MILILTFNWDCIVVDKCILKNPFLEPLSVDSIPLLAL